MRQTVFATVLCAIVSLSAFADPAVIALDGEWSFRLDPANEGLLNNWQNAAYTETVRLPGSLDQNGQGTPNTVAHPSMLSRLYEYVGPAWYQRDVEVPAEWGSRTLELFLERCHWETRLWVDGVEIGMQDSLCVPHVYSIAPLKPGKHRLALRVDNSVKFQVGMRAHSITEHTQTNWNGVIGRMELRALEPMSIASVDVRPDAAQRTANVRVALRNTLRQKVAVAVRIGALGHEETLVIEAPVEGARLAVPIELGEDAPRWDEFSPQLIDLDVSIEVKADGKSYRDSRRVRFGLRDIATQGSQFMLNGRPYFVRGTLECCVFPLTGYPAMDQNHWRRMMETARQYGLNHFRFHSWCPPEAAFAAADEAGITFQVETPVWSDLGKNPVDDEFIREESRRIFAAYGNHPSFVMMAVGNEPSGPDKDVFLNAILPEWKITDDTKLYTTCSGWPELPVSDFHVVHERNKKPYRLHGGPLAPSTTVDYSDVLEGCSAPAIAHELGQWCVYPDYREIPLYTGTLRARNLEGFRDSLRRNHMLDLARDFAVASGKLQRLMYKADIETLLRTPGAGGFQLLALQDFPGQGSALEGFLDAFWNSKGVVTADEFRQFCSETVPLLRLDKFVYTHGETLRGRAEIAHFGPAPIAQARPCWTARTVDGTVVASGAWDARDIPLGNGIPLGDVTFPLDNIPAPAKLTLAVYLAGTTHTNSWDVWVYPANQQADEARVTVARRWDNTVEAALRRGKSVLLLPTEINPDRRVKGAFEPIFWNTQWFPNQPRHLGILCDPRHPALASFPNDGHTDWQWWELLNKSWVMQLDGADPAFRPLVYAIDDWNKNRRLGAVFEARVGRGRLLVCTLDISSNLDTRPAAAALRRSLLQYMNSKDFAPQHSLSPNWLTEAMTPR